MNASSSPEVVRADPEVRSTVSSGSRVASVDMLRGLVVWTMIFVNDLAGASDTIVPGWMKHFHGRSGMTFVDLVFPAFLFIVGMSLPLSFGSRLQRGDPRWKLLGHVLLRTLSLLFIGILMVNETPDSAKMGWSGTLWSTLMYLSAILAFCVVSPRGRGPVTCERASLYRTVSTVLRMLGLASLVWLALVFRGSDGHQVISFAPFSIHHEWYGILGLIGWAYLAGAIVFLVFGTHRTALLACAVLMMCLYPAERTGTFNGLWLAKHVGIGGTLGSLPAITVAGMLLATGAGLPGTTLWTRTRFTLLFIASTSAGALLLHGLYGINKNQATPSWCLWACAITATVWLILHLLGDAQPVGRVLRPLAMAGQNVFLAYLISEMLPSAIELAQLGDWYGTLATPHLFNAIARSAGCAVLVLSATAGLNAVGFRLRL